MEQTYQVLGMSCTGCQAKIKEALNALEGIKAEVDLEKNEVYITNDKHYTLEALNAVVAGLGHYRLQIPGSKESSFMPPQERFSPSSVYYCPMECEGDKVYFVQGERCPDCKMFLVPIEEKSELAQNKKAYSEQNLPERFLHHVGDYYCPMFCEEDKTYASVGACPICVMSLQPITKELVSHIEDREQVADQNAGKYYCPMFCEGDKVYDSNVGCPICGMDLVKYPDKNGDQEDDTYTLLKNKFWIALAFTIPVFVLSMGSMWYDFSISSKVRAFLEASFTIPVLFYSGWFLMKRGWVSFKTWNLNMFSLIALGVSAAFIFSVFAMLFPDVIPHQIRNHDNSIPLYFEAVCVIITLVILGQLMEAAAHKKTGKAIEELMKLSPDEATLMLGNEEKVIALEDVKKGDILKVKPGEKIPVDGYIVEGSATIDESMITGEPIPLEKTINDKVSSGTVNNNQVFLMKAEKVGDQTLLSHIIKMVNEASRSRAPIQNLTDKVAKIFVPVVIGIAMITFILWFLLGPEDQKLLFAFVNAVAVLIVACPCALGLATPMSLMVGIGKAAQNGILIKNAEALEQLNKVKVLITDKTGTLTEGQPSLQHIESYGLSSAEQLLQYAASLNQNSLHPLSKAILERANDDDIDLLELDHFKNESGLGLTGQLGESFIMIGNDALLELYNLTIPDILKSKAIEIQSKAHTISYITKDKEILGFISFTDLIKPDARKAIQMLKKEGVDIIMMTGDNAYTAKAVADELGITTYKANCLPEDKINEVKRLQALGEHVAMTGDGINDAPALAQANVGIAMGTGSDIAMESAEITLLKGDLLGIVKAKILSKKLLKNIKENLFFAFIYNSVGIPLAAGLLYPFFGILLSPMIAAAAMSFSSVSVILNSLRLNSVNLKI